jgi:tripartite-type tricarboxylate transporter receptor subunit TctC
MRISILRSALAVFVLHWAAAGSASAQQYPNRPIKLVVSSPAGTSPDVVARLVAEKMATKLGQPIVVDNRPGGGHLIAVKTVANAEPDGYTLLLGAPGSLTINPAFHGNSDSEPSTGLVPTALFATIPIMMAVSPQLPSRTLAEFVDYTKAHPGALSYGAGPVTPPHLLGEFIRTKTGADISFVPYRGTVQSLPDLFGGRIQMLCESLGVLLPHIQEGKLRPLVVTSTRRLSGLPDVPTLSELGIDGFPPLTWMGIVAPPRVPDAIVAKLNMAANEVLEDAALRAALAKVGFSAQPGPREEFAALIATEIKQWSAVVEATHVVAPAGD